MTTLFSAKGISTEHKLITYGGYDIHYYCCGNTNKRSIILLHPAYSDHSFFDPILPFLIHEYHVITIDMIGHGASSRGKSKDQINSTIHHIQQIMKAENLTESHIVGVSTGALIAQYFAQNFPYLTKSLTSVGGFDINHPCSEVKKVRKFANAGVFSQTLFSMDTFRRKKADHSCSSRSGRAHFFKSTASFKKKNLPVLRGIQTIIKEREIEESVPTLILIGEHDIEQYKSLAAEWYSYTNCTQHIEVEGSGHCIPLDKPMSFSNILLKFIQQEEEHSMLV